MFSICYGNSHVNNADVLNVHIKGKSTKMYWLKYIYHYLSKQIKTPIKAVVDLTSNVSLVSFNLHVMIMEIIMVTDYFRRMRIFSRPSMGASKARDTTKPTT